MKRKIPRILGVALTVALLVSLFAIAAPVAAGTQSWSTIAIPSTTGMVLAPGNTFTGPLVINSDGSAIYAGAGSGVGTLGTNVAGTATWSTTQAQLGGQSALLTKVGTGNPGSTYVEFAPAPGATLANFQTGLAGYSFYHLSSAAFGNFAQFELRFTEPGGIGWVEVTAVGLQNYAGIATWVQETLAGATLAGYGGVGETGTSFSNWTLAALSGIQGAVNGEGAVTLADAWVLTRVRIELWEPSPARSCYIDNVTIAGITYDLEAPRLIKSIDGGRTWTQISAAALPLAGPVTDIVCSSIDPNTVYVTDGYDIWRSDDAGVIWVPRTNLFAYAVADGWTTVPTGMITSIDVGYLAQGPHIFAGVGLTGSGGVFVCKEWDFGMPWEDLAVDINRPSPWATGGASVLDVKVDPTNFVTTQMVMAVAERVATGQTYLTHHYDGAQWNSMEAADAELRYQNTNSITSAFRAQIWLPDGFNASLASGLMQYFVGIASTNALEGDVYLVVGAALPTASPAFDLNIGGANTATSITGLDGEGMVTTASMLASGYTTTPTGATGTPLILSSQNGGATWTANLKRPTGGASGFFPTTALSSVLVMPGYASSGEALVGTHGADCGVSITNDFGLTWNTISLMNVNITSIDDLAMGSMFMTTTSTTTIGATPAVLADAFTISASAGAADDLTITNPGTPIIVVTVTYFVGGGTYTLTNTSGTAVVVGNVINLGSTDVVTITSTAAGTMGSLTITGPGVGAELVVAGPVDVAGDGDVAIAGASPLWNFSLPDISSQDQVDIAVTGTFTVTPTGTATWNVVTGILDFPTATDTALVATTTTANPVTWGGILFGAPTAVLTTDADGDCAVAIGATVAPAVAFTLYDVATAAVPGTPSADSSVWRYASNWERVFSSSIYAPATINFIVESSLVGDALFVADVGGTTIWRSLDNGQVWVAQVSALLGGDNIFTLVAIDANTLVVGGYVANTVYTTTTNGVIWFARALTIAPTTPYGSPNSLAVSDSKIVVGCSGGNVALSEDSGVTWSGKGRPTLVTTAAFVALGGDDTIYATFASGGVYKRTTSWKQLDKAGDTVVAGNGIVTAPGITDVDMVYAADGTDGVCRIKTNRTVGELLADTGITGLWCTYTPGANVLYTIKGLSIRTYTDILAIAGSGVVVSSITPTTCAISWNELTKASSYLVVVNTTEKTNFYTAVSSTGVTVTPITANTAVVTGLLPVTTYYVSVWVATPVSSFLFDGAGTEFTTMPSVPVNLVPVNGATHVSLNPSFAWAEVTGAASYEMQLGTDPTFTTILGTVTTEVPFYSWTDPLLEYDTDYFWRVRAVTDAGFSDWCTYNFHTKQEPTAAVVVEETTTQITLTLPAAETPGYIWAIIVVGGILTLAVIILIVRTRRVV